jgi:hypothetical protein
VIIHPEGQNSQGWIERRAGLLTASELDNLITPEFKIRTGEMPATLLATKLAERWLGVLPSFTSFYCEQGSIIEESALSWLAFELNIDIQKVGLITDDLSKFGASPDGVFGKTGVEIKSPQPVKHTKNLIGGVVPKEHLPQIYGGLYVTGFDAWYFLSYHRSMPKLLVKVERDEAKIEVLKTVIEEFNEKLDAAFSKMVEMNNGILPPKREPMVFASDIRDDGRFDINN